MSEKPKTTNTLPIILGSLVFYPLMTVSMVIVAALVLLAFPLGFHVRYRLTQLWTGFSIWCLKVFCGIRYSITGQEHIPDHAVIVLAKHQSTWETLFLNWYLPPLTWVLKRELFWLPFFGWALALVEPIAINRKSNDALQQVLAQGKQYLDKGRWVLLFPEGTRSAPGERKRYKLGGARLAADTGYPILPIAHNAGEFWPRRKFVKQPGEVKVVIGPLIETQGLTAQEISARVEAWIEGEMEKISGVPMKAKVSAAERLER